MYTLSHPLVQKLGRVMLMSTRLLDTAISVAARRMIPPPIRAAALASAIAPSTIAPS
jgi:hypothetical protein